MRVGASMVLVAVASSISASSQTPTASQQPTFRTTSTLATIDAVALDDQGHPVTDLRKDEFEVIVNGERQTLQQALYVGRQSPPAKRKHSVATQSAGSDSASSPDAPTALNQHSISSDPPARTIALVVDDLNLSFESMHDIRQVIKAYVNTRLASDDFVAIIRTTAANDAREQFTTDRKALRAAADRLVWDFRSQHGVSSSSPVKPQIVGTDDPSNFDNVDANRGDYLSAASLDALRTIAVNIRELPGRKSIVFVSEGFPRMFASRLEGGVQWNALTRALDETNRAGVVIYPLDPRGLQTGGLTAEDDPQMRDWGPVSGNMSDEAFSNRVRQEGTKRRGELIGSQESLYFIAYQTGGFAITNTNNLGEGLARIVADQDGYYLLGYEVPTGVPLASWNFEGVRITVRRPHVRLRYRQGVLGTVPH